MCESLDGGGVEWAIVAEGRITNRPPTHTTPQTRVEQGEIFAAEGYAKVTGKVGVCIATSGPGATNLVTGLADALLDSVPLVAITGQVGSPCIPLPLLCCCVARLGAPGHHHWPGRLGWLWRPSPMLALCWRSAGAVRRCAASTRWKRLLGGTPEGARARTRAKRASQLGQRA